MILSAERPMCFNKPVVHVKDDGRYLSVYEFANSTYKFELGHPEIVGDYLVSVPMELYLVPKDIALLKKAIEELEKVRGD